MGEGGRSATVTNTSNLQSNTNMEMKIVSKIIHSGALFLFLQICFLGVDFLASLLIPVRFLDSKQISDALSEENFLLVTNVNPFNIF